MANGEISTPLFYASPTPSLVASERRRLSIMGLRDSPSAVLCEALSDSLLLPPRWTRNAALITQLCSKMGFPYYTKATALTLLGRYSAFHEWRSKAVSNEAHVNDVDIVLGCTFVACKVEETVKKARDLILALNQLLISSGDLPPEKELDYDSHQVEDEKRKVIATEKKLLESVCFDFGQFINAHRVVIQLGKMFDLPTDVIRKAWYFADESYYCTVSIQYPSHTISLACLYLACNLFRVCDDQRIPKILTPEFCTMWFCRATGVLDTCIQIIHHNQVSQDESRLHDPAKASGVDLLEFAELGRELEMQLEILVSQRIYPDPPPSVVPDQRPVLEHAQSVSSDRYCEPPFSDQNGLRLPAKRGFKEIDSLSYSERDRKVQDFYGIRETKYATRYDSRDDGWRSIHRNDRVEKRFDIRERDRWADDRTQDRNQDRNRSNYSQPPPLPPPPPPHSGSGNKGSDNRVSFSFRGSARKGFFSSRK